MRLYADLRFSQPSIETLGECEVVFFATPHAAAMHLVPELYAAGIRVIDLSADFRLKDAGVWADWYGEPHACPELLDDAVYGMPEINRAEIAGARLVASPGCYPTAVVLGLLPLLEAGAVSLDGLIADAKTGVSGAGKTLKTPFLYGEMAESFKAYGVAGHRHLPEIRQELEHAAGSPVGLTFVPHLAPMVRGIHATLYARPAGIGLIGRPCSKRVTRTNRSSMCSRPAAHLKRARCAVPMIAVLRSIGRLVGTPWWYFRLLTISSRVLRGRVCNALI